VRLADTVACERAQSAWDGLDEPGAVHEAGVRVALERTFDGEISLDDVWEWAQPLVYAIADAGDGVTLRARVVGALSGALILGANLRETNLT
jgi:hypothetical protein